jgi:hypothetical protein
LKTSEILTVAKRHLAISEADLYEDKTRYVCVALSHFIGNTKIRGLVRRINKSLGGTLSVAGWLYINGHATLQQTNNTELMQAYRHRWLEALAQEYAEKGE